MDAKYIANRAASSLRELATTRGALIVFSTIAAILAYFVSGTFEAAFTFAAISGVAGVLLLMSRGVSAQHGSTSRLRASVRKLEHRQTSISGGNRPRGRLGFDQTEGSRERRARNRQRVASLRAALALEATTNRPELVLAPAVGLPERRTVVTVVVVSANDAEVLPRTLESIREQSFGEWNCLIVDDASLDKTVAVAWDYVTVDSRFAVIKHMAPQGLAAARNTGLRSSSGTLVTFLRAGDVLQPDSLLQRVESYLRSDVEGTVGSVSVATVVMSLGRETHVLEPMVSTTGVVDLISTRGTVPFGGRDVLCRSDVLWNVGGFNESVHPEVADADCWHRVMRSGCCLAASEGEATVGGRDSSISEAGELAEIAEGLARVNALSDSPDGEIRTLCDRCEPLRRPIWEYSRSLDDSRRAVEFAAACLSSGDRAAAVEVLDRGLSLSQHLLLRHVDLEGLIERGFVAGLDVSQAEVKELGEELAPLFDELLSLVTSRTKESGPESEVEVVRRFGVLFCPQTARQAAAMREISLDLPAHQTSAFIMVDAIEGDQGVAEVLADSGVTAMSFNVWYLSDPQFDCLVVGYPRSGVVRRIVDRALEADVPVIDIELGDESVMLLPEVRMQQPGVTRRTIDDAKKALGDMSGNDESGQTVSRLDRIQRWDGVLVQNSDTSFVVEEEPTRWSDGIAMARFKNRHEGERCVIIGNGPSLNDIDLSLLADEVTFGVNGIFYAADAMGFDPTYYVVEDTMVMADNLERIREYSAGHKLFPSIYRDMVGDAANVTYFTMNGGFYSKRSPAFCIPRFSTDASQRVYSGQSVTTINLQLAYYMGFTKVILIGMDFSYTVPDDAEVDGNHIVSAGDDPNHFHPDYFGAGKTWKDPKLDRVLANYQLAKVMYESDGRRIVNATPGGKLELFERVRYEDIFGA